MTYFEIILIGIVVNFLMFIVIIISSFILTLVDNLYKDPVKETQDILMIRKKISEWVYARDNAKIKYKYKKSLMLMLIPFANILNAVIIIYQMIIQTPYVYIYNRLDDEIQEFNKSDIQNKSKNHKDLK